MDIGNFPISPNVDDRRPETPHGRALKNLMTALAGVEYQKPERSPLDSLMKYIPASPGPFDSDISAFAQQSKNQSYIDELARRYDIVRRGGWSRGLDINGPFVPFNDITPPRPTSPWPSAQPTNAVGSSLPAFPWSPEPAQPWPEETANQKIAKLLLGFGDSSQR